ELVGNIGQMAQGAGVMAFGDVGVEILHAAAADRGNEIAKVVSSAWLGGDVLRRNRLPRTPATRKEAMACDDGLLQMEHVADRLTSESLRVRHGQAAHLEDHLGVAEIHQRDLRVWRLALIAVAESAADGDDAAWQGGTGDCPTGDVELVHPLVADVA